MKRTYVKTFYGVNFFQLENKINDYVDSSNVDIIHFSIIKEANSGLYAAVVAFKYIL